jgi:hypothetical protein
MFQPQQTNKWTESNVEYAIACIAIRPTTKLSDLKLSAARFGI